MELKKNKNDIIVEIANETNMSKKDVKNVINLFIHKIKSTLLENGKVLIKGLGTFDVKVAKARKVNDFRQEDSRLKVGERYLPKFKYSKPFIKEVKEKLK